MSIRIVFLTALLFVSPAEAQNTKRKKPPKLPDGVSVEQDITFAETEHGPQKLDLYKPADHAGGPLPVIVFVHGGGWLNGDKASGGRVAAWIVSDGYAVVSINYRLTGVAQWPAQIDDCYAAVRWVHDHAEERHLDAERVGVWGTSAGGHLAGLLGYRPDPAGETPPVQAVCDWFGPADLLTMPANVVTEKRTAEQVAQSNGAKLLGASVPTAPDLAKDASPIHHVSADDPPSLLMHGEKDPGVPLEQSRRLAAALERAGVPVTFHVVPGAGHGGKEFATEESRGVVREFFANTLKR